MAREAQAVAVVIPRETVNDETVKLVSWLACEGGRVEKGQPIAEIETSKAVLEIESPSRGFLRRRFTEGAEIAVGEVLCTIAPSARAALPKPAAAAAVSAASIAGTRFSRKAWEAIKERGLDPARFAGKGLVRERDVLDAIAARAPAGQAVVVAKGVSFRREALPRVKQIEVGSLSSGDQNRLASLVSLPCPSGGLRGAREKMGPGGGLAAVVREAAGLLRGYPAFNAFYAGGFAHYYEVVNAGFVVDGDRGLRVPVVKQADKKSAEAVNREMQDLMLAYFEDKLTAESLSGGTFTVTDLSAEGVVFFHPLINQNQSAILGLGAQSGEDGTFQLILAFDHRLSQGRTAARFLKDLRERLAAYA